MQNDKAFAAYALTLTLGILAVLAGTVAFGIVPPPSPLMFLEHLAMGLGVRWAYKSYGGFDWAEWSLMGHGAPSEAEAPVAPEDGLTATS
jgi:hypothetical protein